MGYKMRIIKFRGMSIGGFWSYGLPCIITKGRDIGSYISNSCGVPMAFNIRPETLTQFTGLYDKNGKEVFEGDIVKYYQPYGKTWHCHIVKWDKEWASFGLFELNNDWCKESDWVKIQDIEIIGNIYQNPELLKD